MDQLARDDIAAAAAAHHELGRDYDGAVAEGLIERIGDEIDKRVDARLGQRDDRPLRRDRRAQRDRGGQLSPAARPGLVGDRPRVRVDGVRHRGAPSAVLSLATRAVRRRRRWLR